MGFLLILFHLDYSSRCSKFSETNVCKKCRESLLIHTREGISLCVNGCPDKYFEYWTKDQSYCKGII